MNKEKADKAYDIFISYRTTHADWVVILANNLRSQGYRIFLDRWSLIPGQHFPTKIHEALKNASCAILLATPDASDSGWVQEELNLMISLKASGSGFFFIPVVMGSFPDFPFLDTLHAVDFGDSQPDVYRSAFQRLLSGLAQKAPGPNPYFKGKLDLPKARFNQDRALVKSEKSFLEDIFSTLEKGRPLMILSQADTNTQIYARALRKQAETLYGKERVFHLFPPNSSRADAGAYFGRLARQCHLEGEINESWLWADALSEKLEEGQDVFLLVSGFENGAEASRAELAGELRQLNERYPAFHPVMMGGERLASLKYQNGSMSLLNIAEECPIPSLSDRDLHDVFEKQYPQLSLSPAELKAILAFTGSHPRLLHFCLQGGAKSTEDCEALLRKSPLPTQLFTRFREERDRLPLLVLLKQGQLGKFELWSSDELVRRLYWANLITRDGQNFIWRAEFIRQTGLEILDCA